jgi:serine protease AprX
MGRLTVPRVRRNRFDTSSAGGSGRSPIWRLALVSGLLLAGLPAGVGGAVAPTRHPLPPAGPHPTDTRTRISFRADPVKGGARAEWVDRDLRTEASISGPTGAAASPATSAQLDRLMALTANRRATVLPARPDDPREAKDAAATAVAAKAAPLGWTAPALLADPNHANDQYVSIAASPITGYLYAVFEGYDLASTDRDIHIARSSDDGLTWTVWEMPSYTLDEMMPDLAVDGAGYIHVVWVRADGVVVRARSSAPDNPQTWSWVRGLATGVLCATPSIAVSGAGDFARVFIAASMVDSGEWTLLWMWSTTGGATLSYDYLYADGYPDLWPDVAIDGATVYLVNGEQDASSGEIEILIARDALSGSFANITNLSAWTAMSCGYPSLAAQGQDVYCAYQLDWDDGLGQIDGDIIYAFSWDGLTSVYGPYEIAADLRENVGPAIFTRDGVVGIAYLDAPANGDEFGLVARLAGGRGHPDNWLEPEPVESAGMVSPTFRAAAGAVGPAATGTAPTLHAIWTDKRDYPTQGLNIYRSRRATRPNLAPFTPEGWSGPLTASYTRGGRTLGPVAAGDTTWVSLAFWNDGLAAATQDVVARLTLDGALVGAWLLPGGLPTAIYAAVEDWPLVVAVGGHDLALVLDPLDAVPEELETDNTWVENLWFLDGDPLLRLSPAQVTHVFPAPAPAPATKAAVDAPPLLTRAWLPVMSAELAAAVAAVGPDDRLPVIVTPAEQVDLAALAGLLAASGNSADHRAEVISALKGHASRKRDKLERAHRIALLSGRLMSPQELWISGQIALRATPDAIAELAVDPEVGRIWLDDRLNSASGAAVAAPLLTSTRLVPLTAGALIPAAAATADKALAWHLAKIGATDAWSQGFDGAGVVVGHLDTGVNTGHPDLIGQLWDGGTAFPHHGWDFIGDDNDPFDGDATYWHGTHTAGLVVGDGTGGTTTGAAPGARLMALRCVPGYYQDLVDALQFGLDHGADVLTMSAGWADPTSDLRASLRGTAEALLAAGVPWFCAAGNGDNAGGHLPLPRDIAAPGDCPNPAYGSGGHTAVITVGATDQYDAVGVTSSRGPTAWSLTDPPAYGDYPYPPGLVKPDLAAPGVAITSTVGASGYATYTGTSMATPLVTGAAAILLQARPLLSPVELAAALEGGALDVAPAGRDNDTGAGRLDIPAALGLLPDTAAEVFWAHNDGPLPLRITDVTWYSAWLSVTPRTALIAPGDSVRFTAIFDPAALTAGTHYDVALFVCNDPHSPRPLAVTVSLGDDGVTDVPDDGPPAASTPALTGQPNPFNPRTALRFVLAAPGRARLMVYGLDGRRLRTLVDGELPAGPHEALWDGCDDAGRPLASGTYLARFAGPGGRTAARKLALVR